MLSASTRVSVVGALFSAGLAVLTTAAPAQAAVGDQPLPGHTAIVPDKPRTNTPRISGGEIWDIASIGNKVYIVGGFSSIQNNASGNTTTYTRNQIASYDINTGLVDTAFNPVVGGGGISTIEPSPDGTKLYIGGTFTTVNGVSKRKLASISPTTGAPVAAFTANGNGDVNAIDATNTTVYAGGRFTAINGTTRVGLVAVNGSTGAVDTAFNNQISGGIGPNGALTVNVLELTPDNTKLVVGHTGRKIANQDRYGVGIIDTATKQLLPWRTRLWEDNLQYVGGIQRLFGGDMAPNGQYFVITSGSGGDRPPINDTVVALPVSGNDNVEPNWVTRMFDSVYSAAITEKAIYVGGHLSFAESEFASDPWPGLTTQGYGFGQGIGAYALKDEVVRRDHVAALDPVTGKALNWNPGSNSYEGNKAMLATPRGLFTGGDGMIQGTVRTGRVAFYDFNTAPAASAVDTKIVKPIEGQIISAGEPFTITGTAVSPTALRRVQVEIIDAAGRYLQDNLTTWGAANSINATLGARTGTTTPWSLTVTLPDARSVKVTAKAYDQTTSDPSKDQNVMESFLFDNLAPTARITTPARGLVTSTSFVMGGTATDDQGVQSVTYFLRDANNMYLNENGQLTADYTTMRVDPDVVGATSTSWSVQIQLPHEGEWRAGVLASDVTGQSGLTTFPGATWTVDSSGAAPTVTITNPLTVIPPTVPPTLQRATGSPITFSGTAADDGNLLNVEIRLQNTSTKENLASDGTWGTGVQAGWYRVTPLNLNTNSVNWSYTTPFNLTPGSYSFTVRATDTQELTTASTYQGKLTVVAGPIGDTAPDTLITSLPFDQSLEALNWNVTGTATDNLGVNEVRVALLDSDTGRYLQANGTTAAGFTTIPATLATPGATSTTWSLPVTVPQAGTWNLTAIAVDTAGQWDTSNTGATAQYLVYPGDADPTLDPLLRSPVTGNSFTEARIPISGRANDDVSIQRVEVAIVNSAGWYMSSAGVFSAGERWVRAFVNSPGSVGSNYSYTTPAIAAGTYTVRVRPVDGHLQYPVPTDSVVTVTAPAGNNPPVAHIVKSCTDNACTFDARTTTDENAATVTYAWNYGNGVTGTGPLPTYYFPTAGTFTVTLTATDEYGLVGTTTTTQTITTPPGNTAPTAVFPQPTCVGLVCAVSGAGSTDPNLGDTLVYSFNWGDGTTLGTTASGTHTYAAAGTYTISMTVRDGWGATASVINRTVTVAP
ncbi:MAG: PKD domain-containing protein [Nocardioides sp.]